MGYAPMGAGHYIKNTGTDVYRILIGFNSGHYQAIDLSEWLTGNPEALLKSNFSISDDLVQKLPFKKLFIVP